MDLNFKVYKRDNTKEDWYDPWCCNEFTEYTYLKCLDCDYKEEIELDILLECCNSKKFPYPSMVCPNCNKPNFIPEDIYYKIKDKKLKK